MEKELLISVIVPVYNGEKLVQRAVESVLCQLDGRIELILVDDGSTDSSGAICDGYAAKHPDIKVVHKKNGGLSSARNAGIAVAEGPYIVFLDADDYLDPNTCSEIIKVIQAKRPDCIEFGFKYISNTGKISNMTNKIPKGELLGKGVLKDLILPPLLNLCKDKDHFIHEFAWNKVYRRDIIQSHDVWFDEGRRIWEDRPFVVHYLRYCDSLYSMEACFYNYVAVDGSLSRRYSMEYFDIILANYEHYRRLFGQQYDFDTQYVNDYWCCAIENMIFRSLEEKKSRDEIERNIISTLKKDQVVYWFSKRLPTDRFERRMNELVTSGKAEEALRCAKKEAKIRSFVTFLKMIKYYTIESLRKVLGR